MLEQAQYAEMLGDHRCWLAEHHNMKGPVAQAAGPFSFCYQPSPRNNSRVKS
jgi:alkanesulfonate monooxygenase SsuD/methylene tetrahydromethanopterin reductase-like flavin-dependent oxidoreductase (luciferase family)